MTIKLDDLAGRRVAVWGLGQEGRSIARVLRARFPQQPLWIIDDHALPDSALAEFSGDLHVCRSSDLATGQVPVDVLIKSPGISTYRPEAQTARAHGILLTTPTNLWLAEPKPGRVIAVTGSNGKSTTSSLIAQALHSVGVNVQLGGNIGQPLTDFLLAPPRDTAIWVVELSSYQTADLTVWPALGVLLNLYPDHVQWHGSIERYFADKLNLFNPAGACRPLLNANDPATRQYAQHLTPARYFDSADGFNARGTAVYRGDTPLLHADAINLQGAHNRINIAAALTVLDELGIDIAATLPAIRDFQGLAHRLQVLGERAGVRYVSDSISTTPEASVAALQTFADRPVTLLLGGQDRRQNYRWLAERLSAAHAVITQGQTGPEISRQLAAAAAAGHRVPPHWQAHDLADAVALAQQHTPTGGVILLSPAAPSFDAYADYRARGAHFQALAGL